MTFVAMSIFGENKKVYDISCETLFFEPSTFEHCFMSIQRNPNQQLRWPSLNVADEIAYAVTQK